MEYAFILYPSTGTNLYYYNNILSRYLSNFVPGYKKKQPLYGNTSHTLNANGSVLLLLQWGGSGDTKNASESDRIISVAICSGCILGYPGGVIITPAGKQTTIISSRKFTSGNCARKTFEFWTPPPF